MARNLVVADWRDRLRTAVTVGDVSGLCRAFVSEWNPHRLAGLPPSCAPPLRLEHSDDIAEYALRLSVARRKDDNPSSDLAEMAMFFEEAASRLATLLAIHPAVRLFAGGLHAR